MTTRTDDLDPDGAEAVVWGDHDVRVRRLPWMTDEQWNYFSTEMVACLEGLGCVREDVAR